ncbi:hypothetical protein V8E53_012255 [Lactarius tabidus]
MTVALLAARKVGWYSAPIGSARLSRKLPYIFPIIGGQKVEQLKENIAVLHIAMSAEQIKHIEDAMPFDPTWPNHNSCWYLCGEASDPSLRTVAAIWPNETLGREMGQADWEGLGEQWGMRWAVEESERGRGAGRGRARWRGFKHVLNAFEGFWDCLNRERNCSGSNHSSKLNLPITIPYHAHEHIDIPNIEQHIDVTITRLREMEATYDPDPDNPDPGEHSLQDSGAVQEADANADSEHKD